jgi:hypothetical protein
MKEGSINVFLAPQHGWSRSKRLSCRILIFRLLTKQMREPGSRSYQAFRTLNHWVRVIFRPAATR